MGISASKFIDSNTDTEKKSVNKNQLHKYFSNASKSCKNEEIEKSEDLLEESDSNQEVLSVDLSFKVNESELNQNLSAKCLEKSEDNNNDVRLDNEG